MDHWCSWNTYFGLLLLTHSLFLFLVRRLIDVLRMYRNLLNFLNFILSILSLSHRTLHDRWFQDERLGVSVPL
jgi:hypothetical protein